MIKMKLKTIEILKVSDNKIINAFNKGYLETFLNDNSRFKLDLRLTIFVDDNCISCLQASKVNNITIDTQFVKFVVELDNNINIRCDRIDVKKWIEE